MELNGLNLQLFSTTVPPSRPTNVSIQSVDIGPTFARICWQPPSFRGIPTVSRYLITVTLVNSTAQPLNLSTGDATRDFNVTGLAPGTTYEFRVSAISESGTVVGPSLQSDPLSATTNFTGTIELCVYVCVSVCSGVAKPWHTQARAQATFACALAFTCRSFKLAPHVKESAHNRKRLSWELNSNESASWILEMCNIFATLTWPENPADAILEALNSKIFLGEHAPRVPDPSKRACFQMLTFHTLHSTVYVALPVPEQLPYSGYTTVCVGNCTSNETFCKRQEMHRTCMCAYICTWNVYMCILWGSPFWTIIGCIFTSDSVQHSLVNFSHIFLPLYVSSH